MSFYENWKKSDMALSWIAGNVGGVVFRRKANRRRLQSFDIQRLVSRVKEEERSIGQTGTLMMGLTRISHRRSEFLLADTEAFLHKVKGHQTTVEEKNKTKRSRKFLFGDITALDDLPELPDFSVLPVARFDEITLLERENDYLHFSDEFDESSFIPMDQMTQEDVRFIFGDLMNDDGPREMNFAEVLPSVPLASKSDDPPPPVDLGQLDDPPPAIDSTQGTTGTGPLNLSPTELRRQKNEKKMSLVIDERIQLTRKEELWRDMPAATTKLTRSPNCVIPNDKLKGLFENPVCTFMGSLIKRELFVLDFVAQARHAPPAEKPPHEDPPLRMDLLTISSRQPSVIRGATQPCPDLSTMVNLVGPCDSGNQFLPPRSQSTPLLSGQISMTTGVDHLPIIEVPPTADPPGSRRRLNPSTAALLIKDNVMDGESSFLAMANGMNRRDAAALFAGLMVIANDGTVVLTQRISFGDIIVQVN